MVGPEALDGAQVLDLYAGTGVMSMEAISRGAARADLVEINSRRVQGIRENLRSISMAARATVHRGRALRVLAGLSGGYDLVFADPPYETREWDLLFEGLSRPELVRAGGIVVAEHRHDAPLAEHYGVFERVSNRRYGDTGISFYRVSASG